MIFVKVDLVKMATDWDRVDERHNGWIPPVPGVRRNRRKNISLTFVKRIKCKTAEEKKARDIVLGLIREQTI